MESNPEIYKVTGFDPEGEIESEAIRRAARALSGGGVVVFPTQFLYGLAADASNREAIGKVFGIKQRSYKKPLLVLIDSRGQLDQVTGTVPAMAEILMDRFWPGGLTLVFQARKTLPEELTGGTGKIGVRLPVHPVALALARAFKRPITATSANLAGQPGCADISRLPDKIADRVDLILDGGKLKGGSGSTVVDITGESPVILRQGAIQATRILTALGIKSE